MIANFRVETTGYLPDSRLDAHRACLLAISPPQWVPGPRNPLTMRTKSRSQTDLCDLRKESNDISTD